MNHQSNKISADDTVMSDRESATETTLENVTENDTLIEGKWEDGHVRQLEYYVKLGYSNCDIAKFLKTKVQRVVDKRHQLGINPKAKGDMRPCLVCSNDFRSEGIHNRLCSKCRSENTWPW